MAAATTALEVEAGDVLRLIQQYLKENNLPQSLAALQKESGVVLNTVDSMDSFVLDVTSGRWDAVLDIVSALHVPQRVLIDLYEQVRSGSWQGWGGVGGWRSEVVGCSGMW